jgi:cell wall assembly regulator SMI1
VKSEVALSLDRIERRLVSLRRSSLLALLREGVASGVVRSVLAQFGLRSIPDLEALYGWRNGTEAEQAVSLDGIHLFPGFYLLSLQDATINYQEFVKDSRWTPGWLPIFASGGGDFYVVALTGDLPGEVRHFRIDQPEHPVEFDSLGAMLETLAEGFDRRIFYVDARGYLEMDDLKFAWMAGRLNRRVRWRND